MEVAIVYELFFLNVKYSGKLKKLNNINNPLTPSYKDSW
jgi:hypothetical protein